MTGISVVIPVGPFQHHQDYLHEALVSVAVQTRAPDELVLVDDMAGLDFTGCNDVIERFAGGRDIPLQIVHNQWRLGIAASFNVGVAAAKFDASFMLGADDKMRKTCIEETWRTLEANSWRDAYYYAGVCYMDTGELQTLPCGEALVTRGLWHLTGGFPVESAVGAPDCALVSILLAHRPDLLIPIAGGDPLVDYRRHVLSDTAQRGAWQGPILASRDILTREWPSSSKPAAWGRR